MGCQMSEVLNVWTKLIPRGLVTQWCESDLVIHFRARSADDTDIGP
jgi:hypothetical protein